MIKTNEEHLKVLRAVPVIAQALVRSMDDTALRRRPTPEAWAAIEILAHMADTDERALARISRIREETEPVLPAFDQEALAVERAYLDQLLEPTLQRLQETITALVAVLEGLDEAGWRRTGQHETHGQMRIADYVAHVAAEDVDHLAQLARVSDPSGF